VLGVAELSSLPREVAAEVVLHAAARLGDAGRHRGATHRALRRILGATPPRRPVRIGRLVVERSGPSLRVGPAKLAAVVERRWALDGTLDLPEVGLRLDARRFDRPPGYVPPRARERVAFDADRLPPDVVVRPRRRGERFAPFGGPASRRVKSFLIDAGVPRWERARVPMVDAAGEVAWIVGVRRGGVATIVDETRRILELTVHCL
jgi:tRNA(Ile)-lysidine synthetase-like protein